MAFTVTVDPSDQATLEDLLEQNFLDWVPTPTRVGCLLDYYEDVCDLTAELDRFGVPYQVT